MQVDHAYMAAHLRPYLELAKTMDDQFVAYLLGMTVEHCISATQKPQELPPRARKLIEASGLH